jgi:hypothetical protein
LAAITRSKRTGASWAALVVRTFQIAVSVNVGLGIPSGSSFPYLQSSHLPENVAEIGGHRQVRFQAERPMRWRLCMVLLINATPGADFGLLGSVGESVGRCPGCLPFSLW